MKRKKPKREKMNSKETEKLCWILVLITSLGYSFCIILAFVSYFIFKTIYFGVGFITTFIIFINSWILYELYKLKNEKKKKRKRKT